MVNNMRIDLKKDAERVFKYLQRRAKEFPEYVNAGPGKDEDEIRLVTLGFGFDQAGWVALVFDTRPKAKIDGEWQGYIEENEEPFGDWFKVYSDMEKNGSVLSLTQHDGTRRSFTSNTDLEVIAECFGAMCRETLQQARQKGVFKKLPLAEDCRLAVEEHEGNYGWLESGAEDEGVDEDEVMNALRRVAKKLATKKQIEYWIDQLDHMAAGKPCESAKLVDCEEFALGELSKIGKDVIVPLLKWANNWADKPEFKPSTLVKKGESCANPNQNVLYYVFSAIGEWGTACPKQNRSFSSTFERR